MLVSIYNIKTDEYSYDNKIVVGGPGVWTIQMFLHALMATADSRIKINHFSYILHNYKHCRANTKSTPWDSNTKGVFDNKPEFKAPGIEDLTNCHVHASLLVDIDIETLDEPEEKVHSKIRNALYYMRFGSGVISNMSNGPDTEFNTKSPNVIICFDDNDNTFIERAKIWKGFLCCEVKGDKHKIIVENNMYASDYKTMRTIRPMLIGYRSATPPTHRHNSRDGHPHVFAEPVIDIIEWSDLSKFDKLELTNSSKWYYRVSKEKLSFLVENIKE